MSTEKIRSLMRARQEAAVADRQKKPKYTLAEVENLFIEKLTEKYRLTERDIQRAFKKFDRDGNGNLDMSELTGAIHMYVHGVEYEQVQELVKYYDFDGDGQISVAEFAQLLMSRSSTNKNDWVTVDHLIAKRNAKDAIHRTERGGGGGGGGGGERSCTNTLTQAPSKNNNSNGTNTRTVEYQAKIFLQNLRGLLMDQSVKLKAQGRVPQLERLTRHSSDLTETIARNIIAKLFAPYVRRGRAADTRGTNCTASSVFRVTYENFANVLSGFEFVGATRPTEEVLMLLFRRCRAQAGDTQPDDNRVDPDILVDMMFSTNATAINQFGFAQPVHAASETFRPPVKKGPMIKRQGDVPLQISQVPFRFVTRKCRTALAVPSDFDVTDLERSASLPDYGCVRDHVFGLSAGKLYSGNPVHSAFMSERGQVNSSRQGSSDGCSELLVYSSAALGVVLDIPTNTQRFFEGHTDDITCISLSRDGSLVATGQVGNAPEVLVWETVLKPPRAAAGDDDNQIGDDGNKTNGLVSRFGKGFFYGGVCAVEFSFDNKYVCAIGCDEKHNMGVWAVATGQLIANAAAANGIPPQILMMAWGPGLQNTEYITSDHDGEDCDVICTVGERHLKFWSYRRPAPREGRPLGSLEYRQGRMGKGVSTEASKTQRCVDFICNKGKPYDIITGGDNGCVYLWRSAACIRATQALAGTVFAIKTVGDVVVCGGAQGVVKILDLRTFSQIRCFSVMSPDGDPTGGSVGSADNGGIAAALGWDAVPYSGTMVKNGGVSRRPLSAGGGGGLTTTSSTSTIRSASTSRIRPASANASASALRAKTPPSGRQNQRHSSASSSSAAAGATANGSSTAIAAGATTASIGRRTDVGIIPYKGGRSQAPKNSWIGPAPPPHDTAPPGARATSDILGIALVRGSAGSQNVTSIVAVTGFGKIVRIEVDIPDNSNSSSNSSRSSGGGATTTANNRRAGGGTKQPSGEVVSTLFYYHYGPLWALATQKGGSSSSSSGSGSNVFATGGDDKWLSVWGSKHRRLVTRVKTSTPIRCLDFDKNDFIAVGHAGGSIAVYRLTTDSQGGGGGGKRGTQFDRWSSPTQKSYNLVILGKRKDCAEDVSDVKFSPNSKMLAVGSHDNFIDIYATRLSMKEDQGEDSCDLKQLRRLKGHSSYITHLDWSIDNRALRSTCGSYELLYWDVAAGKQKLSSYDTLEADALWHTETCVLGFKLMGIWPPESNGTNIHAVDVCLGKNLVATADDFGKLNIHNYPCVATHAPRRSYSGHSSHVMNVKFMYDNNGSDSRSGGCNDDGGGSGSIFAVTVGGNDNSALLWRLVRRSY